MASEFEELNQRILKAARALGEELFYKSYEAAMLAGMKENEMKTLTKIYLAGRYGRREELMGYASDLKNFMTQKIEITSRWIHGEHEMKDEQPSPEEAMEFATDDIQDLEAADILIAFTEEPGKQKGRARGGRHVELGYALAKEKKVIVVGHRENVFCHLPEVMHFHTWAAATAYLRLALPDMSISLEVLREIERLDKHILQSP